MISTDPMRVATAWLTEGAMIGAQTGPPSGIGWYQHCHASIHTAMGWLRVPSSQPADARAAPWTLEIASPDVTFETEGSVEVEIDRTDTTTTVHLRRT